jgi:hypothetical protein
MPTHSRRNADRQNQGETRPPLAMPMYQKQGRSEQKKGHPGDGMALS